MVNETGQAAVLLASTTSAPHGAPHLLQAPGPQPEAIVVVPVYNEQATVLAVLDAIECAGYTSILVVDDGSTDGSCGMLDEWARARRDATVLHLPANRGKSAALREAWTHLQCRLDAGTLSPETVVICVDADGQHDLGYLAALLTRMRAQCLDAVIARRDLSYHGLYKRAGNWTMAALGSLCAGTRLHDIESGYRLLRLGSLLHAQSFYDGRRYSEGVELAVVLARLGYRVDNEFVVRVPIPRTRTHLTDAVNHAASMLGAWYRVVCWRDIVPRRRSWIAAGAAGALCLAFLVFLGVMLTHDVYLGNDSAQSYAHVWAIARSVFEGRSLPLHIPELESGQAYAFPYAAIPWLPTALVRPFLGDRAVTASMVIGVGLLLVSVARWLPRSASPLMLGIVLLNWQLWNGALQFQLPTMWALAFASLAAAEFNRERPKRGTAWAAAALYAHPVMGAAGLGLTLLAAAERDRRLAFAQAVPLAIAGLLALPAVWMFWTTPSVGVVAAWSPLTTGQILTQRLSVLWWPWLVQRFRDLVLRAQVPLLLLGIALLARNVYGSNPQNLLWRSLPRFEDYLSAGMLSPTANYRVLTMSNQEDGMTQLLQAGAHLAQEFFDESIARRSFATTEEYRCFLAARRADRVLVQGEWTRRGTSNEVQVLDALVREEHAALTFRGTAGTLEYTVTSAPPDTCNEPRR